MRGKSGVSETGENSGDAVYWELLGGWMNLDSEYTPVGSGTVRSGAGAFGGGRPKKNLNLGAPAQLPVPIAAAKWTL